MFFRGKKGGKFQVKRHHFNLRTKLVLYFLFGFVIPIIIFGVLLFSLQFRNSETYLVRTQETSVFQLADRISQELRDIRAISNLYYLDDELIAGLL